jgi:bifunctional non-homologous end joining protein LigD
MHETITRKRHEPALARYGNKRDFKATPEPAPAAPSPRNTGRAFVVHKHAARRLHFDLRLELDGVLKSWAVPKGPSLSPNDKRLAVEVEDHPLEYRNFQGIIPAGQYGAGSVEIWDAGEWKPDGEPHESLQKGTLKFHLNGKRLHGAWTLVRMKKRAHETSDNWLLIKERDSYAGPSAAIDAVETNGIKAPMPKSVSPQLAVKVAKVPHGENWIYEMKYDGYRIISFRQGTTVTLISRNGKDWTNRFGRIAAAVAALAAHEVVLDGEICYVKENGATSFQDLQDSIAHDSASRIFYFVFDILYKDGYDLRTLPLGKRKEILRNLLSDSTGSVRYADHVSEGSADHEAAGNSFLRNSCRMGLEGVVAKNRTAHYHSAREPEWQKIKCTLRQEMVIGGFTRPRGSRNGFGALLLGFWDAAHALRYAGKTGTGFTEASLKEIHAKLQARVSGVCPFTPKIRQQGAIWVRPDLVCEVQFAQITKDGRLRQAAFLGLREDKEAGSVTREQPEESGPAENRGRGAARVSGIAISHPSKIMEPHSRVTKLELARYLEAVSPEILRFAGNRLLSLVRCPDGSGQTCFFQKHRTKGVFSAVNVVSDGGEEFMYVSSREGLVELAQFDVMEIHGWGSRADAIESPDQIILDLDPGPGLPWKTIAGCARTVRDVVAEFGITSFVKTTGGKGLHVVVPVLPENDWAIVKNIAHAFALELAKRDPDRFTATISKAARGGKVFVDYLRNGRGATAIVPYSPRRRDGATVSMPVSWNDLESVHPSDFTVHSAASYLAKRAHDPWASFERSRKSLPLLKQSLGAK